MQAVNGGERHRARLSLRPCLNAKPKLPDLDSPCLQRWKAHQLIKSEEEIHRDNVYRLPSELSQTD